MMCLQLGHLAHILSGIDGAFVGCSARLGLIRMYFFFLNKAIYSSPISVSGVQFGKKSSCKKAVL